jgi:hypothetical protein
VVLKRPSTQGEIARKILSLSRIQSKKKEGLPRPSEVRRIPVPSGTKGLLCIDLNFFVGTNTIHRSALDPWTQLQHIRLRTVAPELSSTVQDLQALTGLAL